MSTSQEKALRNYRRRLKQHGIKRVELQASVQDATLLRQLAKALRSEGHESDSIRKRLRTILRKPACAKELLAAAPLEGVQISRSKDRGRIVEL